MRLRGALVGAALGLVLGGCGAEHTAGDAANSVKQAVDPVAEAASNSVHADTVSMRYRGSMTEKGKTDAFSGTGVLDIPGHRGRLNLVLGKGTHALEVFQGAVLYLRLRGKDALPPARPWIRFDGHEIEAKTGEDASNYDLTAGSGDPARFLQMLEKTGNHARKTGTRSIDGVQATQYHVDVDVARVMAHIRPGSEKQANAFQRLIGSKTIPVDVAVDGQKRLVYERVRFTSRSGAYGMDVTAYLFDYDKPATIRLPDRARSVSILTLEQKAKRRHDTA